MVIKQVRYPKSRLELALETAQAVREIIDLLEDQPDISNVLVNLACQDSFEEMNLESSEVSCLGAPLIKTKSEEEEEKTESVHFGFDTKEVQELCDEEE